MAEPHVEATETNNATLVSTISNILAPVTLPCSGRAMQNKLVKVALYEHLAPMFGGPPNRLHLGLYKAWGRGNWGIIMTGNVQVCKNHLSLGRDIVIPDELTEDAIQPFKALNSALHSKDSAEKMTLSDTEQPPQKSLVIMQLSHAGRQSTRLIGGRKLKAPLAPSPVGVSGKGEGVLAGLLNWLLFQTPKEMTLEDIDQVVQRFIMGATVAWKSGFDGVELHSAHGYLLSSFLSPKTNKRCDLYSADKENATRLLKRIIDGIKDVVPDDFVLGIKINSADYVNSESSSDDAVDEEKRIMEHIVTIAKWGLLDFIEISGGDYESPKFMGKNKSRRQAFFSYFSQHVMDTLDSLLADTRRPLILLTGGLRTPSLLCDVYASGHADLLGIGRGSLLRPDLPLYLQSLCDAFKTIDDPTVFESPFEREPELGTEGIFGRIWSRFPRVPLIGAGVEMAWYVYMMRRIGRTNAVASGMPTLLAPDYDLGAFRAILKLWFWSLADQERINEK